MPSVPAPAPTVSVATLANAVENHLDGVIQFTRVGDTSSALTVGYSVSGSANPGSDYTTLSGTVTFAANSATADVTVATIDDSLLELNETVTVTLTAGTGYVVSSTASTASLNLADDDTRHTFTLSDGTVGLIGYDIPWGQVDPDAPSQSITPTVFNLTIAAQNFAYGVADYTAAPILYFSRGDLVGFSFSANLAGTGSPYLRVTVAGGVATAIDAATGMPLAAPVANTGSASMTLDFSTINIPATGSIKYTMYVQTADNKQKSVEVEVFAGATQSDVRDLFKTALKGAGIVVDVNGATKLNIQGTADSGLKRVEVSGFGNAAPKLIGRTPDNDGKYPEYVK